MDKLRALQIFMEIADTGSFSAASKSLQVSLPVVTRTLAALEKTLGVRLFHRTTRTTSLTDEGQAYLILCRPLLQALQDADTALSQGAVEPTGRVTVTAPVLFGQKYIAPLVTQFVMQNAKIKCSLLLLDRIVNLVDEGIDLAVRIGHLDDSSLIARRVGLLRHVVVTSPAYLRDQIAPTRPADLKAANCIKVTGEVAWTFHHHGKLQSTPVAGNLEFNHLQPAIDACVQGVGVGVGRFLSYQVAPEIRSGRLVIVLGDFEPPPIPVHLVYPHARLVPGRTRAMIEWLHTRLTFDGAQES